MSVSMLTILRKSVLPSVQIPTKLMEATPPTSVLKYVLSESMLKTIPECASMSVGATLSLTTMWECASWIAQLLPTYTVTHTLKSVSKLAHQIPIFTVTTQRDNVSMHARSQSQLSLTDSQDDASWSAQCLALLTQITLPDDASQYAHTTAVTSHTPTTRHWPASPNALPTLSTTQMTLPKNAFTSVPTTPHQRLTVTTQPESASLFAT